MTLIFTLLLAFPAKATDLNQAVQSTLQKNELVGQSRSQLKQAEEQVTQLKSAIYPSLYLNGTYLVQPKLSDPLAADFFPERQTTTNFTLTQPLFRGLREFAAVRRQKDLFSAQEQIHVSKMVQLYQEVAESFMEVLALEQDLRNIGAQQSIYKNRVKDLQGRTRRGESSSTEALTAQSTAAALDAEFQIQSSKLRTARENFALLTGLPADTPLTEDTDAAAEAGSIKPLEEYLARIEDRPDVRIAKQQLEASGEEVSIAKGAHWPTIDLVGNYYLTRPPGFTNELKWDVSVKASLPLFEGGMVQSQVRQAAAKRGENDLALNQLRRKSQAEIRSLHGSLRMRGDQLKALKLASDLAEKNYLVLLRDARRSLARSIDVQLGLTEYRVAKRTYDQARFQARLERIRLDLAAAMIPPVLSREL